LRHRAGLAIAARSRVTAQTMQGILANLERDDLLERHPDPTHGRVLRSELTDQGRSVLARAHLAVRDVEDRMIASFGEKAAGQLASALSKCADDLRISSEPD
jgi:DNA-binding MarR family transcriptional regulator